MSMTLEPQVEIIEPQVDVIEATPVQTERRKGLSFRGRPLTWTREHLALTAILLLSAFLGLWGLDRNGYSNDFYAAAVKSMLAQLAQFFLCLVRPRWFCNCR